MINTLNKTPGTQECANILRPKKMTKASLSAEVIDLVSSDDEDVTVVKVCSQSTKKRSQESFLGESSRVSKKIASATGGAIEEQASSCPNSSVPDQVASSGLACSPIHAPVVLDDYGSDNAVITYGILQLVNGLNAAHTVLTCNTSQSGRRSSTLEHIQQQDRWSCGYRNLQMMLTAILPHLPASHAYYHSVPRRSHTTTIPSLGQLQRGLEQSWKAGFDPRGAQHYRCKIEGKDAKIGAIEVASLLSFWGVDATVVQFVKCAASRLLLSKFVKAYFSKKLGKEGCSFCHPLAMTNVARVDELLQFAEAEHDVPLETQCDCPCLPLYLQWEGHSVTIAGIETTTLSPDARLLVLDPMKKGARLKNAVQQEKSLGPLWLSCKQLLQKDVQLIVCSLRPLSPKEKAERRQQVGVLTAAKDAVLRTSGSS
jgi:hypothetical protein